MLRARVTNLGALGVYPGVAVSFHQGDLAPFALITPCGYAGLPTIDLRTLGVAEPLVAVQSRLAERLSVHLSA